MPKGKCAVDDCRRDRETRVWCNMHYLRWKRHGDPNVGARHLRDPATLCSIDGCRLVLADLGWCDEHLARWRDCGDPLAPAGTFRPLPGESWHPVVAFEGVYEVSDAGRVRSLPRNATSGNRRRIYGRILRPAGEPYLFVALWLGGKCSRRTVHSLVCEAFHGPCPEGMEVRHLDDNKLNNQASNLRWGTRSENMQDRRANGIMYQLNKTHCPHDHEWTSENTGYVLRPDGSVKQRKCLRCADEKLAADREARRKRRERAA